MLRKLLLSIGTIGTIGVVSVILKKDNTERIRQKEWCNCHEYCHGTGYVSKEVGIWTQSHDGYVCGCDCGCGN